MSTFLINIRHIKNFAISQITNLSNNNKQVFAFKICIKPGNAFTAKIKTISNKNTLLLSSLSLNFKCYEFVNL